MNINEQIVSEIKRETASTRRLISQFTDKHLDWSPHKKSMTVGQLMGHVVDLHNWVGHALVLENFDLATNFVPLKPATVEEALEALDASFEANIAAVSSFTDEDWHQKWTFRFGDHIISETNKLESFRHMMYNHLIHHRGQLSVYLRLLDLPVPGLYGPSADDSMMA